MRQLKRSQVRMWRDKRSHFTFGRHDKVVIAEAPSDEAMGKALLVFGGFGTVRVETLKAFPEKDHQK